MDDPLVDHCEAAGNAQEGIHLGTYATRGIVRYSRAHDNGQDGPYLCWFVRQTLYEGNQSWNNGEDGISLEHVDTHNNFVGEFKQAIFDESQGSHNQLPQPTGNQVREP